MSKRLRKALLLTIKIGIAVALLAWVLSSVHWHDYVVAKADGASYDVLEFSHDSHDILVGSGMLWWRSQSIRPKADFRPISEDAPSIRRTGFLSSLRGIDVPLLVLAAGGFVASLLIVAVRWWLLLRIQDIRIRPWEAVRLTFLGQFFNAVIPGVIGGDLVKAYYVAKHTPKRAAVLVSIVIDRIMGLTELSGMAAVMILAVWIGGLADISQMTPAAVTVAVLIGGIVFAFLVIFSKRVRHGLRIQKLYERSRLARHIWAVGDAVGVYKQRLGALLGALLMTLGAHILFVGAIGVLGWSLALETPFHEYFIYVPLIYIIGAVPLTPGGVGLIEKFYVVFFATAVTSPSRILVLALLARLIPVFWGLPGALVAITGPKLPKAEAIQAELGLDKAPAQ